MGSLKQAALKNGVSKPVAAKALDGATPQEKVLRLSKSQPEFKTPIWDYFGFLVDEDRVEDGRAMMRKHDRVLRAAERQFGVDRHVIAAVWGVETDYGRETGDIFLPHALATLACQGERRRAFWRGELTAALKLVDRGDVKLDKLYGSWAGAFGHTQFIPSTYQRLAVDFDGDGRRDLRTMTDALGSTANLLMSHGWRRGEPWLQEVKVPANLPWDQADIEIKHPVSHWKRFGVAAAHGSLPTDDLPASLLLPMGRFGPAFFAYPNFGVYLKWNQAMVYAITAAYYATRLAGAPAVSRGRGDIVMLTTPQVQELQRLLVKVGYKGEPDGRLGLGTRQAVKAAQMKLGLPADSFPTADLLERLRAMR